MNNANNFRIYNEKLELIYETTVREDQEKKDKKLDDFLRKSQFFLNVGNLSCYRIIPNM